MLSVVGTVVHDASETRIVVDCMCLPEWDDLCTDKSKPVDDEQRSPIFFTRSAPENKVSDMVAEVGQETESCGK